MAATPTTYFLYQKPAQGDVDWDTTTNTNWDILDADLVAEHTHTGNVAVHGATKKLRCQIAANAAARVAIVSPREGDMVWQSDADAFYIYDGAAWDLVSSGAAVGYSTGNVWIPAPAIWPSTTSGCAAITKNEYVTNDVDVQTLNFDKDSDEFAQTQLAMPHDWDAGTVKFSFYWTCNGGGAAETVSWNGQGRSYANSDALDQAWGTTQAVVDTWLADDDAHISAQTAACTLAGGPAASELVMLRFWRDVSGDDLATDAQLIGVMMEYTRN